MKRWLAILLLLAASVAMAAEPWMNAYHSAMAAVAKSDWKSAAEHLEKAIAAKPTELSFTTLRSGSGPYLPHYWLGTAKIQLGDKERGAQELRISESQGAIQKTTHYSDLRNALARIEREKSSSGDASLATLRSSTDKTLTAAVAAKGKATAAGAPRTEVYGRAAQKLQDAFELRKAGDAASLNRAAALAKEATQLFSQLSGTPSTPAREQQKPPVTPPARPPVDDMRIELVDTQAAERQLRALRKELAAASSAAASSPQLSEFSKNALEMATGWDKSLAEVESQADTDAIERGIAQQRAELKRLLALNARPADAAVKTPSSDPVAPKPVVVPAQQPATPPQQAQPVPVSVAVAVQSTPSAAPAPLEIEGDAQLRAALLETFVLFGRGELDLAESKATAIIDSSGRFEAYILRGCARYARALLENQKKLEADAAADFLTARTLNSAAKLDRRAFSPKLIEFFESSSK